MDRNILKKKSILKNRPVTGKPKREIFISKFQNNFNKIGINDRIKFEKILKSEQNKEKEKETETNKYLESLSNNNTNNLEYILSTEMTLAKKVEEKKEKLKNIDLLEKDYMELYDWTTLFNNSRPLSSYTNVGSPTIRRRKVNLQTLYDDSGKEKSNTQRKKIINRFLYKSFNNLEENQKEEGKKKKRDIMEVVARRKNYNISNADRGMKRETEFNNDENQNEINFDKRKLIIAGERRNSIPLLQSIFKQIHPNQDIILDHIKLYNNTMKPLGDTEISVDYTKNERWKLSEKIREMREQKGCLSKVFNSKYKPRLVLDYYNNNDPIILMFDKMVQKSKIKAKKLEIENNNFNPIINKLNTNYNLEKNQLVNELKEIEGNKPKILKTRPKTGFKNMKTKMTKFHLDTRPKTSFFREYNIYYTDSKTEQDNKLNNKDNINDTDYKSSKSLPYKFTSNVGNKAYDKMNNYLKDKKNKSRNNYFSVDEEKNIFTENKNINNKNLISFNKRNFHFYDVQSIFNPNKIWNKLNENLFGLRYYRNMGGKHYSSSYNVHVKNKRKNKEIILKTYYTKYYQDDNTSTSNRDESVQTIQK